MPNLKATLFSKTPILTINNRGFTLVELLVAISILAIISAIGYTTYVNAQKVGRDGRRKQDLRTVAVSLELYYQQNKSYPTEDVFGASSPLVPDYINQAPVDPMAFSHVSYSYSYTGTPTTYLLCAQLENINDKDIQADATTLCGTGKNFYVKVP